MSEKSESAAAVSSGELVVPPPAKNKNYQVLITAYAAVLVINAESEEKAMEYATDACSMGDLQLDSAKIEQEVDDDRLENARKHADVVAEE